MEKRIENKKLLWSICALGILTGGLVLYAVICVLHFQKPMFDEGKIKSTANQILQAVQNKEFEEITEEKYLIFDMHGVVIKSTIEAYEIGAKVNLERFRFINVKKEEMYYDVINIANEETLVLQFRAEEVIKKEKKYIYVYSGFVVFAVLISMFIFVIWGIIKREVFEPISQMQMLTKRLRNHDFSKKLSYRDDTIVGEVCHDIEVLRDNLGQSEEENRKLKENEKLLLAWVSHDLKTPLAAIQGYTEAIYEGVVEEAEEIREYTEYILKKVEFLKHLIKDITEHSETELNQFTIEKEEVYAKSFFEEIFREIKQDVAAEGKKLEIGKVPDVLLMIDKKRIQQVVHNIVFNSVKYTAENGNIAIQLKQDGRFLIVVITDDGTGISVEDIPFIFDKFYRGEKARSQKYGGSGLGLSIAKHIVERHGGKIECDSVIGKGTVMSFSLKIL